MLVLLEFLKFCLELYWILFFILFLTLFSHISKIIEQAKLRHVNIA